MQELFFSISIDVGVSPVYRHAGLEPNCTLRMFIVEDLPAPLGVNSDAQLVMAGGPIVYSRVLTDEVHDLQADELIEKANHTVTWGFATKEDETLRCDTHRPPASHLYIGIQCLRGWRLPDSHCTSNLLAPPNYDDCRRYCPFVLTARAIPRQLGPGDTIHSMLGPGEWQTFRLQAGLYELL